MQTRRRIKYTKAFHERLIEEAQCFKDAAAKLPSGTARELLLRRVQQAEHASRMNDWLAVPARRSREQAQRKSYDIYRNVPGSFRLRVGAWQTGWCRLIWDERMRA